MSETGGSRPDLTKLTWAEGPGAYPVTEPLAGKKQVGWDDGPPGEVPLAAHHNWLLQYWAQFSKWLNAAHVREFADLAEAIAATVVPEIFRIGEPSGGNRSIGAQVYSVIPGSFTGILDAASDGENNFFIDTSGYVSARLADDGSQIWNLAPTNISVNAIAADGRSVYVAGNVTSAGLVKLNRNTGAETGRGGAQYGFADIASNGAWAAGAGPIANRNNCYLYGVTTANPTEVAAGIAHGDTVDAVAVDDSKVYFGGAGGSSAYDVEAYTLNATPALVWQIVLPTSGAAPNVSAIATDGELVYVTTDRVTLTAGGNANFFILQAYNGAFVGAMDVQIGVSTVAAVDVAVDHDRIYVSLGTAQFGTVILRFTGPQVANTAPPCVVTGYLGSLKQVFDADGVAVIAFTGTTSAERYFVQSQPVTFQRVALGDVQRRPFHKYAIPLR